VGGAADLGEWNPGATEGSGTHTVLLCAVENQLRSRRQGGQRSFTGWPIFFLYPILVFSLSDNFHQYFLKILMYKYSWFYLHSLSTTLINWSTLNWKNTINSDFWVIIKVNNHHQRWWLVGRPLKGAVS
jgi:hypothetical protein